MFEIICDTKYEKYGQKREVIGAEQIRKKVKKREKINKGEKSNKRKRREKELGRKQKRI